MILSNLYFPYFSLSLFLLTLGLSEIGTWFLPKKKVRIHNVCDGSDD